MNIEIEMGSTPGQVAVAQRQVPITLPGDLEDGIGNAGLNRGAAVVTHAIAACTLAMVGDFGGLILLSGGAVCLAYVGCCAAAWRLQQSDRRGEGTPFQLRGGALIPLIGCAGLVLEKSP